MKALIFSDLHAHTYQEFSELKDGVNSRLQEVLTALVDIETSALALEVDAVFFTGDIFHLKNYLDSQVIRSTLEALESLAVVAPIYICAGNHDYKSWDKDPVLLEFASGRNNRIKLVEVDTVQGLPVFIFPYHRNVDVLNERLDSWKPSSDTVIALLHQDLVGARYGGHEIIKGVDATVLAKKFRWSFVGHYHNAKKFAPNVVSVGAPLQHNFGETEAAVGWWFLDTTANVLEFIPNESSPRFIDLEIVLGEELSVPGRSEKDYYRVAISGGRDIPDEIKALRWKRVVFKTADAGTKRANIKFSDTTEEVMKKYIQIKNVELLDEQRLLATGRRYL